MTQRPVALCFLVLCTFANAKIYKKCELAIELLNVHEIQLSEIPIWVCIAKHESNFNTSAVNKGSGDHGLFQISDIYWCTKKGQGKACNAACSSFEDDEIGDDIQCIRRIFNEHKRLSGNGFNAWVVYPLYCKNNTERYVEDCFDANNLSSTIKPTLPIPEGEDEYEFPPLPVLPKFSTSLIHSFNLSQKQLDPEILTKTNEIKSSLMPTTSILSTRQKSERKEHEDKYPAVGTFLNLGYYISPASTSKMRSFIYGDEHQEVFHREPFKPDIGKTLTLAIPEEIAKNISTKNAYAKSRFPLMRNKVSQYTSLLNKLQIPFKSSFANYALDNQRTVQKTKLGRGYIIERNGRGGFRLRLE